MLGLLRQCFSACAAPHCSARMWGVILPNCSWPLLRCCFLQPAMTKMLKEAGFSRVDVLDWQHPLNTYYKAVKAEVE